MRDAVFPSIWAEHDSAQFNPVMVREKLITTVENAPVEWGQRLDELGFKKGNRAWLKLGGLTPTEYEYLSPAIVLRPFPFDEVLNAHGDVPDHVVPLVVQDEIAALWQNNLDAVLFELSFHGVTSKARAWSHTESALAGDNTPEADAVLELAFTRMRHEGRLVGAAFDYAAFKGWGGSEVEWVNPKGETLQDSGESISWTDDYGVAKAGRLAMPLRVHDDVAWVYENGPRFVGGISVSTLIQIPLQQLQGLNLSDEASLASFSNDAEGERASYPIYSASADTPSEAEVSPKIALSENHPVARLEAFGFLSSGNLRFPEHGWRLDVRDRMIERADLAPHGQQILSILEQVEANLRMLSQDYYGATGVGFCIVKGARPDNLALRVGSYSAEGFYSHADSVEPEHVQWADTVEFAAAARGLSVSLQRGVTEFMEQTRELGRIIGAPYAFPAAFYESYKVSNLLGQIARKGGDLTAEQFLTSLTVANDRGHLVKDTLYGEIITSGRELELFNSQVTTDTESSYGHNSFLRLAMKRGAVRLISLNVALKALQAQAPAAVDAVRADLSFATVEMMGRTSSVIVSHALHAPHLSLVTQRLQRVIPVGSYEDAEVAMRSMIGSLSEHLVSGDHREELVEASNRLDSFQLIDRFYRAVEATEHANQSQLAAWVENELHKSYQGKTLGIAGEWLQREIAKITDKLRGNQGVVVFLASGASGAKLTAVGIPAADESVIESRDAVLGAAAVQAKERYRCKGKAITIDAVSYSDAGLCALLAGQSAGFEKGEASKGQYQDAGIVAGFARKDIRTFSHQDLVSRAVGMSTEQKSKYLKRELIWPRTSFEEMKEQGIQLQTAIALDLLWKSLPKAPKSASAKHARAFTDLVAIMRDGIAELMERLKAGDVADCPFGSDGYELIKGDINAEFRRVTNRAFFGESVREVYGPKDHKVRGVEGLSLRLYEPFSPHVRAMAELLQKSSWADVLKAKKVARVASSSRVLGEAVVRLGEDYRNGTSVITEDFLKTFGFSGVEYGNWTNQAEREKHLNLAYDSMMDLSRILGWEPMALSLGGRLGLCIGSRGQGGPNAGVAHFDAANFAMNLTRLSGDGALAHEYWHAFAAHFGFLHTGKNQDLLDTFGYSLQKPGLLPELNSSDLREPVRKAFRNLQVAIMRKPKSGGDPSNIEDYVELSEMMIASNEMGSSWPAPAEMFARAMELWVVDQVSMKGGRNDYLVKHGEGGVAYPDEAHRSRINRWASPLLEAIELEVRKVLHPTMGEIEMPVLNSEHVSAQPLSPQDLISLASNELDRLFASAAPRVMIFSDPGAKAGLYKVACDVVGLNDRYADQETFYHESWHACEAKLLSSAERSALHALFSNTGPVADLVKAAMELHGLPELAIASAIQSPSEMQAYAFQLWAVGKLDLSSNGISEFYRVKGFVDGVRDVAALVGGEKAERLFKLFMQGGLAQNLAYETGLSQGRGISVHLSPVSVGDPPLQSLRLG